MFEHYLITRFNLKNPKWSFTKNNELLLTDEWMDDRIQLFKNYCLPSVMAQTKRNFKWLIYFDNSTSERIRKEISDLVKPFLNIDIFYIEGMENLNHSINKYLLTNSKSDYLITSRIDNDDCISKHFIDEIHKKFDSQDFLAVDIISGYTLNCKPCMLGKKEHIFNPFISLIEKNENPKTVWFNDHNMWKRESRITQIKNKRLWMSIIHEKNKINEFDGYGNVKWEAISNDFIVSNETNMRIKKEFIPYKEWLFLSLKNKLYVKSVLFSKTIKKRLGIYKMK